MSPFTLSFTFIFLLGSSSSVTVSDVLLIVSFSQWAIPSFSFLLTGCASNSVESVILLSRVKYGIFSYNFDSEFQFHETYFLKIAKKCLHGYADIFESEQEQDSIVSKSTLQSLLWPSLQQIIKNFPATVTRIPVKSKFSPRFFFSVSNVELEDVVNFLSIHLSPPHILCIWSTAYSFLRRN